MGVWRRSHTCLRQRNIALRAFKARHCCTRLSGKPRVLGGRRIGLANRRTTTRITHITGACPIIHLLSTSRVGDRPGYLLTNSHYPYLHRSDLRTLTNSSSMSRRLLGSNIRCHTHLHPLGIRNGPRILLVIHPVSRRRTTRRSLICASILADIRGHQCCRRGLQDTHVGTNITVVSLSSFEIFGSAYNHRTNSLTLNTITATVHDNVHSASRLIHCNYSGFITIVPSVPSSSFTHHLHRMSSTIRSAVVPNRRCIDLATYINNIHVRNRAISRNINHTIRLLDHTGTGTNAIIASTSSVRTFRDRGPLILVISSSRVGQIVLGRVLGSRCYVLRTSGNHTTLSVISHCNSRLSLILLSVIVPNMDNFRILTSLSHQSIDSGLPIVVVSDRSSSSVILHTCRLNTSSCVGHPFSSHIIHHHMDGAVHLCTGRHHLAGLLSRRCGRHIGGDHVLVSVVTNIVRLHGNRDNERIAGVRGLARLLLNYLIRHDNAVSLSGRRHSAVTLTSTLRSVNGVSVSSTVLGGPKHLAPRRFRVVGARAAVNTSVLHRLNDRRTNGTLVRCTCRVTH